MRPLTRSILIALTAVCAFPSLASAGVVTTKVGSQSSQAFSLARQADGKLVAGGRASEGDREQFALVRWLASGKPDPSFGSGGRVVTSITGKADVISDLAIQRDGKIVAVGQAMGATMRMGVVRYLPNGALDPTFGDGGKVQLDFNALNGATDWAQAETVALQPDGKIVVGGSTSVSTDIKVALGGDAGIPADYTLAAMARLNPDGSLDGAFGRDGRLTANLEDDGYCCRSEFRDLAVASDGTILSAAATAVGRREQTDGRFAYVRVSPQGAVLGTSLLDMGAGERDSQTGAERLVVQGGRVVLGGRADAKAGLARLTLDGVVDGTFGTGGQTITAIPGTRSTPDDATQDPTTGTVRDLIGLPDGRLALAPAAISMDSPLQIFRYSAAGSLDPAFGKGGQVALNGNCGSGFYGLAAGSGGAIYAAGFACLDGPASFTAAAFDAAGRDLASFGAGAAAIDVGGDPELVRLAGTVADWLQMTRLRGLARGDKLRARHRAGAAGKLTVTVKAGRKLIASGTVRFARAGDRDLRLAASRAGRRAAARMKKAKLTVAATFKPAGARAVSGKASVTVRR